MIYIYEQNKLVLIKKTELLSKLQLMDSLFLPNTIIIESLEDIKHTYTYTQRYKTITYTINIR